MQLSDLFRSKTFYDILHEIKQRGDFQITWAWQMTGMPILFGFRGRVECIDKFAILLDRT